MPAENTLADKSAHDLLQHYAAGDVSPVEVTEAVLDRIERVNPVVNAFVLVDPEAARAAARASEARWHKGEPTGAIDGIPTTTKDIIQAAGWPCRRGSRATPATPDAIDAPTTRNLRREGAVLLGKTTSPEFGWKAVTDCPLTGITRNPWNPEWTPGGSSGGASAAAAAGMGALHVGTDGGGSIRIPASFTRTFGLKPTFGRVPAYPHSPFGTLAHIGPMTRTVADAELMLRVLSQPDSRDPAAINPEFLCETDKDDAPWSGRRIAWLSKLPGIELDPEVDRVLRTAIERLGGLGARVEPVTVDVEDVHEVFRLHWYGGARQLARSLPPTAMAEFDPGFRAIVEEAQAFTLDQYLDAMAARTRIGSAVQSLHERYDLIMSPAVPVRPPRAGDELTDASTQKRWTDWAPYSFLFNLTQQPAASVPCGFTTDGCPVGLQVVGPRFADFRVLHYCAALETALADLVASGPVCPWMQPRFGQTVTADA
jgi:aspartyl-tRNA(Asn)/glutamyl-tRNA(Gln) amidotransferase subunit A